MYGIEVLSATAGPVVTAAELRAWLRLPDAAEDSILSDLVAAAVELFEAEAVRPVLATSFRQHLSRWPTGRETCGLYPDAGSDPGGYAPQAAALGRWPFGPGQVVLGLGGVSVVTGVFRRLADGTPEALDGWDADLFTPPARVTLAAVPDQVLTAAGYPVSPVGHVEFTAGWVAPDSVPKQVKTAIKLLAAHWYGNREAFSEKKLGPLSKGWADVVAKYWSGVSGSWGQ